MCWLDDVYHFPCGHWGVPVVSARCPAGYLGIFMAFGCSVAKKEGMQTSAEPCASCKWRHRTAGRAETLPDSATQGSTNGSVDGSVSSAPSTIKLTPEEISRHGHSVVATETDFSLEEVEVSAQIMAKVEEERARVKRDAALRDYGVEACQLKGTGTWLVSIGPPLTSSRSVSPLQTESQSPPESPELNQVERIMVNTLILGTSLPE